LAEQGQRPKGNCVLRHIPHQGEETKEETKGHTLFSDEQKKSNSLNRKRF
jgi:hypothetical protein